MHRGPATAPTSKHTAAAGAPRGPAAARAPASGAEAPSATVPHPAAPPEPPAWAEPPLISQPLPALVSLQQQQLKPQQPKQQQKQHSSEDPAGPTARPPSPLGLPVSPLTAHPQPPAQLHAHPAAPRTLPSPQYVCPSHCSASSTTTDIGESAGPRTPCWGHLLRARHTATGIEHSVLGVPER